MGATYMRQLSEFIAVNSGPQHKMKHTLTFRGQGYTFLENSICAKTALALTAGKSSHCQTDTVVVSVPFTKGRLQTQHESYVNTD
jgi:hypothetical protein